MTQHLRIAELFAGIGGVTGGFLDAGGFDPVFLNDVDPIARRAFADNFPALSDRYHLGKVEKLTGPRILDLAGGHVDGLLACPPCQGFSAAGLRDQNDPRNQLLGNYRKLVWSIRPQFFVMENVPSLLGSELFRSFREVLGRHYVIRGEVLNAAEYGVPQLRRRAVVIGLHRDLGIQPSLPAPTHGGRGKVFDYYTGDYIRPYTQTGRNLLKLRPRVPLPKRDLVTLEIALGDLPAELAPGAAADSYYSGPKTNFQRRMRGRARRLTNHESWSHGVEMVRRLVQVKPGDCPSQYGRRARNTRYFSQAYARLHGDGLARTLTTNFHNPGSGRFTHYAAPRTLTLREALRVQSFPDEFHLDMEAMLRYEAERLVGNAFPRLLAQRIGLHVLHLLGRGA